MAEQSFPFIVSNGPKVTKDPAVRTIIRKQAMKDVSIARKKRNSARANAGQGPASEGTVVPFRSSPAISTDDEINSSSSSSSSSSFSAIDRISWSPETVSVDAGQADFELCVPQLETSMDHQEASVYSSKQRTFSSIPFSLSFNTEYELARIKFGIDLIDLSTLTNFNVGKSAITLISADPYRLASLMNVKQWSYLEYVPARYSKSECLTAATNCLLAKVQMVLSPNPQSNLSTLCNVLYGRALRSLQEALTSETSDDADVLAATQLLSMHELLDPKRDMAWSHHVNGSARLIAHRSPKRFVTDFDKALFASHVGAMVSESLVGIEHCYLEQPEWTSLYLSIAQDSDFLTDRSQLAINVRKTMFSIPGIWRDIDDWVNSDSLFSHIICPTLEKRCRRSHQELTTWMEDYKAHCVRLALAELPPTELAVRRELYGSAIECLLIIQRLLATVCESDRHSLETETQALAHSILSIQDKPQPKHSWLFTTHEVGVAQVTILTKEQWEECNDNMNDREISISTRKRYNKWSRTLRMHEIDE